MANESQPPTQAARQTGTPYTLRQQEGVWIAHAIEFDLVAAGDDKDMAVKQLKICLTAQIAYGAKQGFGVRQCYFPAPVNYWNPPYEFMDWPTLEEIAALKFTPADPGEARPTPPDLDAERLKFEKWAGKWMLDRYESGQGNYISGATAIAWNVWKACAALRTAPPEYRCDVCGEILKRGSEDETVIHFEPCRHPHLPAASGEARLREALERILYVINGRRASETLKKLAIQECCEAALRLNSDTEGK